MNNVNVIGEKIKGYNYKVIYDCGGKYGPLYDILEFSIENLKRSAELKIIDKVFKETIELLEQKMWERIISHPYIKKNFLFIINKEEWSSSKKIRKIYFVFLLNSNSLDISDNIRKERDMVIETFYKEYEKLKNTKERNLKFFMDPQFKKFNPDFKRHQNFYKNWDDMEQIYGQNVERMNDHSFFERFNNKDFFYSLNHRMNKIFYRYILNTLKEKKSEDKIKKDCEIIKKELGYDEFIELNMSDQFMNESLLIFLQDQKEEKIIFEKLFFIINYFRFFNLKLVELILFNLETPSLKDIYLYKEFLHLKEIDFTRNGIEKITFLNTPELEEFNCSDNELETIPFIASKKLKRLILKKNKITTIGKEILNLKNSLKMLDLGNNAINKIPEFFKELKKLEVLILGMKGLKSFPKVLCALPNLRKLIIKNVKETNLNQLEKLEELKELNFEKLEELNLNLRIKRIISITAPELKKLEVRILGVKGLKVLCALPNLRKLIIKNVKETDLNQLEKLEELNFEKLEELNLNLRIKRIISITAPELKKLNLRNNTIEEITFLNTPKLEELDLFGNNIKNLDQIFNQIMLPKLHTLNILRNPIIISLDEAKKLPKNLKEIHFYFEERNYFENQITLEALEWLKKNRKDLKIIRVHLF